MKLVRTLFVVALIACFTSAANAQFSSFWHSAASAVKAAAAKSTGGPDRLTLETAEKNLNAEKDLTVEKKFVGRLPHGYSAVVTDDQRQDIYKVQEKYFNAIEMLKLRLSLLERERSHEIDAVLKADQKTQIKDAVGDLESEKADNRLEQTAVQTNDDAEEDHAETRRYHHEAKQYVADAAKDAADAAKEVAQSDSPEAKTEADAAVKDVVAANAEAEAAAKAVAAGDHVAARKHSSNAIKYSKSAKEHSSKSRSHHRSHKK